MFHFFKNLRNKRKEPSLQEAEQVLRSVLYSSAQPRSHFSSKLKESLLAQRRANQFSYMDTLRSLLRFKVWVPVTAGVLVVLLLVPIFAPFGNVDNSLPLVSKVNAFTVEAIDGDISGVEVGTGFRLTAENPIKKEVVEKAVRLEPALDLTVKEISDTEFEIRPSAPLEGGTVYNVVIQTATVEEDTDVTVPHEQRFAFQVKDTFKVLKSLPGNKQINVPLNTGIELTFSHEGIAIEDFKSHFSITPKVDGKVEKFGKALVFVPTKELAPETLYKATLSSGLQLPETDQKISEDYSFEFFTQIKGFEKSNVYIYFQAGSRFPAVKSGEEMKLPVHVKDINSDAIVKIYSFKSIEDYTASNKSFKNLPEWVCDYCVSSPIILENKKPVMEFKIGDVLVANEERNNADNKFLVVPALEKKGIYVLSIDDYKQVIPFQVSALKGYVITSAKKSFVWVHRADAGTPVKDANVKLVKNSSITSVTNQDGLAEFSLPKCEENNNNESEMLTVRAGGDDLVFPLYTSCAPETLGGNWFRSADKYWSTLTTDRPLYRPTDKVQFWGLAKLRDGEVTRNLTVSLNGDFYGLSSEKLLNKDIEVSDIGTFKGELNLDNVAPGQYVLEIFDGKNLVAEKWISIETYNKPALQISASIEKDRIFANQDLVTNATVSFFDGTPAPGIDVNYYDNKGLSSATTDKNGEIKIVRSTAVDKSYVTKENPAYFYYNFSIKSAELGESNASVNARIFYSDYKMSLTSEPSKSEVPKVVGTVNNIDINNDYYFLGDVAKSVTVTGKILIEHENKIESGSYYDPISKKIERQYRMEYIPEQVGEFNVKTDSNGKFVVDFPFTKARYIVRARVADSKGRVLESEQRYFFKDQSFTSGTYYHVVDLDKKGTSNSSDYLLGDKPNFALYNDNQPIGKEGKTLFFEAHGGITKTSLSDNKEYQADFKEEDLPNKFIGALWFDGSSYRYAAAAYLNLKKDERYLKVDLSLDKEKYRPGDNVTVSVVTKDIKGNPHAAEVNLKAVDEAIYALTEDYGDAYSDVYANISDGILEVTSVDADEYDVGGKGGGGGDGGLRSIFKDTALFDVIRTGEDGKGSLSFKLSDDITTFRVTAIGITKDLFVGTGKTPLVTTLPFFADITTNNEYLLADSPSIRVRVAGTELDRSSDVTYTISIPTLGVNGEKVIKKAGENFWFALPKLAVGKHAVTVRAQQGKYTDAIKKEFSVVDSLLTVPKTQSLKLEKGSALSPVEGGRTSLVFALEPYASYYRDLQDINSNFSSRFDAQIARLNAQRLLKENFGESEFMNSVDLKTILDYQDPVSGGLKLLPYDDSDLALSFHAARLVKDVVNVDRLDAYFVSKIDGQRLNVKGDNPSLSEVVMALAGRAALGKPVLNDLKLMLKFKKTELTSEHKLTLAYGFANLGDWSSANALLDEVLLGGALRIEGDAKIVNLSKDENTNRELSALAATTAVISRHSHADALWLGAKLYTSTRTLLLLDKVTVLDAEFSRLPRGEKGVVKYMYKGVEQKVELAKSQTHRLDLARGSDLSEVKILDLNGPVGARVSNDVAFGSIAFTPSETLKLNRWYEVDGKRTTTLKEGDLVTVVLQPIVTGNPTLSEGQLLAPSSVIALINKSRYEIIDLLPAGLVPVTSRINSTYYNATKVFPTAVEGQRISFFTSANKGTLYDVRYVVRVVSKGVFVAEPALIREVENPTRMNVSELQKLEID